VGALYPADVSGGYGKADYKARLKIQNGDSGDDYNYIVVRYQDSDNFYAIEFIEGSNVCVLYKVIAGVWTQMGSSFTIVDDDVLELEAEGSTIRAKVNFETVTSGTDSTHSSEGKAGLGFGDLRDPLGDASLQSVSSFRVITL
jgi:hypothetical protein